MSKWLQDYNIEATKELLEKILAATLGGDRVMFLTPPGKGQAVVQRNRVKLSRVRDGLKAKNRKIKRFTLNSTIHPYTDSDGKRHDCVVMWTSRSQSHEMDEMLEDMLSKENH